MRHIMIGLLAMVVAGQVVADEIALKDGRRIKWKGVTDEGDHYEVTTPEGAKISVKKEDFDRIIPETPEIPLTGATFTFDKKRKLETIDLFAKVDTKKGIGGEWRSGGGALTGTAPTAMVASRVSLGVKPPEEYDISFTLERTNGKEGFYIGLVGGGREFVFYIDAFGSQWSGPVTVDGLADQTKNGVGIAGTVLKKGTARLVTIMVRRDALIVQLDKKDFCTWKAQWNRLSMPPHTGVVEQNVLFVGMSSGSTYQIRNMTMTAPKN